MAQTRSLHAHDLAHLAYDLLGVSVLANVFVASSLWIRFSSAQGAEPLKDWQKGEYVYASCTNRTV